MNINDRAVGAANGREYATVPRSVRGHWPLQPKQRTLSLAIVVAFHALIGAGLLTLAQPMVSRIFTEPVRIELIAAPAEQAVEPKQQPSKVPRAQAPEKPRAPISTAKRKASTRSNPPVVQSPTPAPMEAPVDTAHATPPHIAAVGEATPQTSAPPEPGDRPSAEPLQAPRFDADYLHNPAPSYPRISRDLGEQGRVLLRVHVNEEGRPLQVLLETSSGHSRLDRAARDAVQQWRFVPARQGKQTLPGWVKVPIVFELNS